MAGLEIKREMLVKEPAKPRQAVLPVIAAVEGMVAQAKIYVALVPAGIADRVWGIPMATDSTFVLGALVLFGSQIPRSMLTYFIRNGDCV